RHFALFMEKEQIIPDVVKTKAEHKLEVKYGSHVVNEGNVLTPTQVKNSPVIKWHADDKDLFTLIMTDPDAPSREKPIYREWHHWLVVNIPGNNIKSGDEISQYIGSGPPKGTGLHRYVFLVYKQPGKIDISKLTKLTNKSGDGRGNFKAEKFANEHHLKPLVACNFFQAEWDDYVPEIYRQLGGH
ncbi:unnamed protein product, partial [Gordionus sp. m RMFG-2023]